MKKTTKILAVLLSAIIAVLSFAACTKEETKEKTSSEIQKNSKNETSKKEDDKKESKKQKKKSTKNDEKTIEDIINDFADARYADFSSLYDLESAMDYCVKYSEPYMNLYNIIFDADKWIKSFEDEGIDNLADNVYVTMFNLTNPDCKIKIKNIDINGNKATVKTLSKYYNEEKLIHSIKGAIPVYSTKFGTYEELFTYLVDNMQNNISHIELIEKERTFTLEKTDGKWLIVKDDSLPEKPSDTDEAKIYDTLSSFFYNLGSLNTYGASNYCLPECELYKKLREAEPISPEMGYEHSKYSSYKISDIKVKGSKATVKVIFNRPDLTQATSHEDFKNCDILNKNYKITLEEIDSNWLITKLSEN